MFYTTADRRTCSSRKTVTQRCSKLIQGPGAYTKFSPRPTPRQIVLWTQLSNIKKQLNWHLRSRVCTRSLAPNIAVPGSLWKQKQSSSASSKSIHIMRLRDTSSECSPLIVGMELGQKI